MNTLSYFLPIRLAKDLLIPPSQLKPEETKGQPHYLTAPLLTSSSFPCI